MQMWLLSKRYKLNLRPANEVIIKKMFEEIKNRLKWSLKSMYGLESCGFDQPIHGPWSMPWSYYMATLIDITRDLTSQFIIFSTHELYGKIYFLSYIPFVICICIYASLHEENY